MLQLIVLNESLQGTTKGLFEGFKIGSTEDSDLQIEQNSFVNNDFIVECNSSGVFSLYSLNKKPLILSGDQNLARIDLIPGLIFSINEVGFSIQEGEALASSEEEATKKDSFLSLLSEATQPPKSSSSAVSPLKQKLSFKFARGLLLNKTWDIPWHPISFGSESNFLFFADDSIPSKLDFLNISEKEGEVFISSEIPNFASLNSSVLTSEPKSISDGDLIEFGQTAFYIGLK